MYIPKQFEVYDKEEISRFLEKHSFGQIISSVEGRIFSTHLPFLISIEEGLLRGHFAVQNPQHREIEGQEVLVTFEGPHGYISPTWYASSGVPTWNYQSVHIYGEVSLISDAQVAVYVVSELSSKYEKSSSSPWHQKYDERLLGAICAFKVEIKEIQCKYKLSQNKSVEDRERVISNLHTVECIDLAETMRENLL